MRHGFAAVALDRGRPADALDLIQHFLRQVPDANRTERAGAFELAVRAPCALGQTDDAHAALAELQALAASVSTEPMRGSVAMAQGVVAAAESEHATSRGHLEHAVDPFERTAGRFEAAESRLELARILTELGHARLAVRKAPAAHDSWRSLGAAHQARRAAALLRKLGVAAGGNREPVFGLSAREVEVLQLVAQGLSNQRIAEALVLSEHTVTSRRSTRRVRSAMP